MIKFEHPEVWGFEHAIRGMRNPLNSWSRSDSEFQVGFGNDGVILGDNDRDLMQRLIRGGAPHRKFLRQIFVSVDITAPFYWWKEFDTYKVGTTANSCSTMHKIAAKEFTLDDFSTEHLGDVPNCDPMYYGAMESVIFALNEARHCYLESKDKGYWWQMIQLLPTSYNQKRTVTMTYENLLNMLEYRRGHKLDEWRQFCDWIFTLPHADVLGVGVKYEQG